MVRGYTAGIIGFTTGTGDLMRLLTSYPEHVPGNSVSHPGCTDGVGVIRVNEDAGAA